MRLHDLPAFKDIARCERLPAIHSAYLHAQHILVAVLGLKITHTLRLLDPRIPHDGVTEVLANDIEARLPVLHDRGGILLNGLVHTVRLASDADAGVVLLMLGCIKDFVDVGRSCQAIDGDLGDVLRSMSVIIRLWDGTYKHQS